VLSLASVWVCGYAWCVIVCCFDYVFVCVIVFLCVCGFFLLHSMPHYTVILLALHNLRFN